MRSGFPPPEARAERTRDRPEPQGLGRSLEIRVVEPVQGFGFTQDPKISSARSAASSRELPTATPDCNSEARAAPALPAVCPPGLGSREPSWKAGPRRRSHAQAPGARVKARPSFQRPGPAQTPAAQSGLLIPPGSSILLLRGLRAGPRRVDAP